MIWNIIDKRKRPYRWQKLNAVIEDTSNDNSVADTDILEADGTGIGYDQKRNVSLHDAVDWAESSTAKVTLYLYDKGDGF